MSHGFGIPRMDDKAGEFMLNDFWHSTQVGRDNRNTARHRLKADIGSPLLEHGVNQQIGGSKNGRNIGPKAYKLDILPEAQRLNLILQLCTHDTASNNQ